MKKKKTIFSYFNCNLLRNKSNTNIKLNIFNIVNTAKSKINFFDIDSDRHNSIAIMITLI